MKENPEGFLALVNMRIVEEQERCKAVLPGFRRCWKDIRRVAEKSLLMGRLSWLRRSIVKAIDTKDVEGLRLMYDLFSRVDGQKTLCEAFKAHVQVCAFIQSILRIDSTNFLSA